MATASIPPAPVETFVDPVPSPDQILALSWAPWLVEFQGLLEGIADQGEAGDVAALFAGCQPDPHQTERTCKP